MDKSNTTEAFIQRWQGATASELSTAQSFVMKLCDLLGVEQPHATPEQDYMFERPVTFLYGDGSTSAGRIDCYRRGHFVLEAKKLKAGSHTKGFDDGLLRARSQGEAYARALPAAEGRPPFVLVVDVGTVIEVFAEFSRSGGTYTPFPDPRSHRIALADLARPEILERLRRIWSDPESLKLRALCAGCGPTFSAALGRATKSTLAGTPTPTRASMMASPSRARSRLCRSRGLRGFRSKSRPWPMCWPMRVPALTSRALRSALAAGVGGVSACRLSWIPLSHWAGHARRARGDGWMQDGSAGQWAR